MIVAGGGVIGVCCAYFLSRAGAAVTLVDRDEIGKGASYGNAGTVAAGHPPLNKPSRVRQSLRLLLEPKSPLYIPVRWDPGLARWLWTFRKYSTPSRLKVSMGVLAPLGHVTLALFDSIVEGEGLDCGYDRQGYYEVCRTEKGLGGAREDVAMMRHHGYSARTLSGAELREIEPVLRDGVVGGVHFPDAATCDPYRFVMELADRTARNGATVIEGLGVTEVLSSGSGVKGVRLADDEVLEAESVVLATGAYSQSLTAKFGLRLPLQAGKGYHRDLVPRRGAPSMHIACVFAETSVFCVPMGGFTRLAGTLEFSGVNHEMRRGRLEQLTTGRQALRRRRMGCSRPVGVVRSPALHPRWYAVRRPGAGTGRTLRRDGSRHARPHLGTGDRSDHRRTGAGGPDASARRPTPRGQTLAATAIRGSPGAGT